MPDPGADIQDRHAPAVLANRLELASRWGEPTAGYILVFRPDPAASAALSALQDVVLAAEPALLRLPAPQLHASIAWPLQESRSFARPKDQIWAENGERWLTAMAAVTDGARPMRLRYHRLVVTTSAVIAVAAEPNPVAAIRRQITAALGLSWPVTYPQLGLVHSTLLRYGQPLSDPAGLLARLAATPVSIETEVTELLMIREFVFPTLAYDIVARLPLRDVTAVAG